jgi:hypothetical protein
MQITKAPSPIIEHRARPLPATEIPAAGPRSVIGTYRNIAKPGPIHRNTSNGINHIPAVKPAAAIGLRDALNAASKVDTLCYAFATRSSGPFAANWQGLGYKSSVPVGSMRGASPQDRNPWST